MATEVKNQLPLQWRRAPLDSFPTNNKSFQPHATFTACAALHSKNSTHMKSSPPFFFWEPKPEFGELDVGRTVLLSADCEISRDLMHGWKYALHSVLKRFPPRSTFVRPLTLPTLSVHLLSPFLLIPSYRLDALRAAPVHRLATTLVATPFFNSTTYTTLRPLHANDQ